MSDLDDSKDVPPGNEFESLSLKDHLIYIFSEGGDMATTVDPDAHSNPIQEAWDQAGPTGTIIYPPRNIEYDSTLSGAGGKRHIGTGGPNGTWFIDTDPTTPSYHATLTGDESYAYFDGIMWRTKNNPGRSAPVFKFDDDVPSWNLGPNMRFRNNSGSDLFHFNKGHVWSSIWENPKASGYNRFLKSDDLDAPLVILAPYLGSDDETTPEFDVNTVGSIFIGHGWNKGGVSCPLLVADGFANTENPRILVGRGNFEPNTDNGAIDSVVKVEKAAVADIYGFSVRGGNYTFNNRHIHIFDSRAGIKNIYGGYNQLVVTGDVNTPGVIFHGRSNSVWNNSGALLTEYVTCTGDVTKKKSTGQGYDGGIDDTQL